MRMIQIQDNISEQKNLKDKLESEQEKLHVEYNKVSIINPNPQKKGFFSRLTGRELQVVRGQMFW